MSRRGGVWLLFRQGLSADAGDSLWTAHAGDSRAVLSRGGKAVRLTEGAVLH